MDFGMATRAAALALLTGSALFIGCAAQPVAECPLEILERANARADDLRWRIAQAERRYETLKVQLEAYTEVAFLRQFGVEDTDALQVSEGPAVIAEFADRGTIDEASAADLRRIAQLLTTRFQGRPVVVEGGSFEGRSLAITRFLVSNGVEPERISAVAHPGHRVVPSGVNVLVMPAVRNTNVCASF